jgi:magnesium chelatase subunit D
VKLRTHSDSTWIVGLLALCGRDLGGAVIDESWEQDFLASYAAAAGTASPVKIVPGSVPVETFTGSLDLAATLAAGKPLHTPGLLYGEASKCVLVRRAGCLDPACSAECAAALDDRRVLLLAIADPGREEDAIAARLSDRLPFYVTGEAEAIWNPAEIVKARSLLPDVSISDAWIEELARAAVLLGLASPRPAIQAVLAARALAALACEHHVTEEIVSLAARLIYAHRAQQIPAGPEDQADAHEPAPQSDEPASPEAPAAQKPENAEILVEAVKAALPPDVVGALGAAAGRKGAGRNMKSAKAQKAAGLRGRRIGHKRLTSLARQRLDVLATLRKAAPWQPVRRKMSGRDSMVITRDDFCASRIKQRNEATAIFAVDASGSTAFQRLAEAKGAVEAILAECYVRRDRVALVSFRSKTAEVLLPPTRSSERARRSLASLMGGGGTPLAAGLDQVFALAHQVRRTGGTPTVILLTDGRANVTRDGEGNKVKAIEETLAAARSFAVEGFDAMVIDVSPDPQKHARALAEAMHARYLPMPRAGALDSARPVRQALNALTA